MMEIQKFFHDPDPLKNRELFGLLGEYGLSQRVRGALGGPVTSEPGRRWFIMTEGRDREVVAFASLRFRRASTQLLHLYALKEGCDVPLLEYCLSAAGEAGTRRLITTDFGDKKDLYLCRGFRIVRRLGRFVRLEKEFAHEGA